MQVNPQTHAYAAGRSDDPASVVGRLGRSALTGERDLEIGAALAGTDWGAFAKIAERNRLWTVCAAGLPSNDPPAFSRVALAAREERARAMIVNSRTLATARRIMPLLRTHSVKAVVFKGPVFHRHLHGDYFFRRSNDLDILVGSDQFAVAVEILKEAGFESRPGQDGRWWTESLGELHLAHPDLNNGVIDLHHRIQQPGCPAPRDTEEFLSEPVMESIGAEAIPALSPQKALILSCISLSKGLVHREASGKHAFDVAVGLKKLDAKERNSFAAIARRQGLVNTVRLAISATEATFRIQLPLPDALRTPTSSPVLSMPLSDMVLRPDSEQLVWPKRRLLLWAMCDGENAFGRGACFAREATRAARSEWQRLSETARVTRAAS